MPAPQTPYEAVLHAARDVAKLDCALDAELLGTALLGSVYAVASTDRAAAVRDFVGDFLSATTRRRSASPTTIRTRAARSTRWSRWSTTTSASPRTSSWADRPIAFSTRYATCARVTS